LLPVGLVKLRGPDHLLRAIVHLHSAWAFFLVAVLQPRVLRIFDDLRIDPPLLWSRLWILAYGAGLVLAVLSERASSCPDSNGRSARLTLLAFLAIAFGLEEIWHLTAPVLATYSAIR
jgi:hypothetical protein